MLTIKNKLIVTSPTKFVHVSKYMHCVLH